ncbi:MAG: hypothetical protein JWR69_3315 [Pedosphaera sp.]|nr:hypothetical protein [Pedosphaera sp.]
MNKLFQLLFVALMLAQTPLPAVEPGDAILGVWTTTDSQGQVEVFKQDGKYFAKIISLKEPNVPADDKTGFAGKPKTDYKNPNPKLRQRPIVGLQFMSDFVYAGKHLWEGGKVYDPESGKTYKCKMTLLSTNRLEVRGFVGFSLLGRTVIWTR